MRLEKAKRFIVSVIEPKKKPGVLSIIYNILMSLIVITSCVFVFIDIFSKDELLKYIADIVEYVALGVFALEYLLKLFVSEVLYEGQGWWKSKWSYITSFDSFIDIICFLSILINNVPKELVALRLLKLIKLARLVKLKDAVDELRGKGGEKESEPKGFRYRIYQIIAKDEKGDVLSKIYDIVSITIILLSILTIILDTFKFPDNVTQVIFICEIVFTVFFAIEYILRVWTADYEYPDTDKEHARMRYIFSLAAIIDLLAILPIFLAFSPDAEAALPRAVAVLKIFKIFKIARLLKMSRYLNGISMFVQSIKNKKKPILFSIGILIFLVMLSSILLYSFENMAGNEQFDNGFSGIVYAVTILSGYGESEMQVTSVGGKIMVVIMMIAGACVVGVPIGIISDEFSKMVAKTTKKNGVDAVFDDLGDKLTKEQKLEIIANYQDKVRKDDDDD